MKVAVILAVLVALVACNELSARIEVSHHNYVPGQELLVNWELVNTAVKPLRLLTWGTPIEGEWNSYMFHIVNIESGVSAAYQGRVFKRASPQIENYSTLSQNVAVSGALDLAQGYHFYEAGRYEITMHFVAKPLVGEPFVVQSNTVEIHVARPDVQPEARQEISAPGSRAVTFNGCTSTEQSTVNNAISLAVSGSANVETYLAQSGNPPKCTTVFTKWFGTYDSTNWNQIETDFQKINNLLASNNFGIDCTCNQPGTYAYVYPNDKTHTIYLCPVFWTSKTTGYNTQPGTLTHESSHFTDVAGTDDIQYGVAGCLDLAETNPSRAVKNADSHEYLQEDNPSTSC